MSDLILICEACRRPIEGNTGSIYITFAELHAKTAADAEWRERHEPGTAIGIYEFLSLPGDIHWRTAHDACRSDRDEDCYEIDAPLIDSWPKLCRWTAHLMEKNWFTLSDWDTLLRELCGEARATRIRATEREAA